MTTECEHTPCPDGYLDWHAWAEKMAREHEQKPCPVCGLWKIWVKKSEVKDEVHSRRRRDI